MENKMDQFYYEERFWEKVIFINPFLFDSNPLFRVNQKNKGTGFIKFIIIFKWVNSKTQNSKISRKYKS